MHRSWRLPLRAATGVFVLNSGLNKRGSQGKAAEGLHGFASTAYPFLQSWDPEQFVQRLSTAEIALGSALLTPLVPAKLAGLGLAAFAGGLNYLYWKAPGLRQEGSLRPTEDGLAVAKDVWMTAIGLALLISSLEED